MNKSKCPHCRQKLGNYLYATECPFCHKELERNRMPTGLSDAAPSHAAASWVTAGLGIAYVSLQTAGAPLPGLGEASSFGGHALRFLGAGLIGAAIGAIASTLLARNARGAKKRRDAFLASFAMPIRRRPESAAVLR